MHLFLSERGPGRAGAGRGYSSAEGRNGKDFGHWARGWDRQVARGAGLRYTRAKDLV